MIQIEGPNSEMPEKDYYKILGVERGATEEEVRHAYRKLALRHHPDRNRGDPRAEERFKEISEAYGVLMDREKRRFYDSQQASFSRQGPYRQQEVFRDMFRNPHTHDLFRELSREFQKYGVQFDQQFLNRVFFGGKGFFFGGIFFGGPIFGKTPFPKGSVKSPLFGRTAQDSIPSHGKEKSVKGGILSRIGRGIETLVLGHSPKPVVRGKTLDIEYHLTLTRREADSGGRIRIAYERGKTSEKLDVTIPPGTKSGSRLKLRGKGMAHPSGGLPGDLYLHVNVTD